MLFHLSIENVAVIESAEIDFDRGFSVLTGETGAGKSILIDSVNLLLGERASKDLVRTGCEKAVVSASFFLENPTRGLRKLCEDFGVEEDGTLLLSREIHADGRSLARINGRPCTAGLLRDVGKFLINIHGQQDNSSLLNPQKHLFYLDSYAGNVEQRRAYADAYRRTVEILRALEKETIDETEKARRLDMLNYQIDEIEKAKIREGEEAELTERRKYLVHAEKIRESLSFSRQILKDGPSNLSDMIYEVKRSLASLASVSDEFASLSAQAEEVSEKIMDLSETVRDRMDSCESSEYERNRVEERLETISGLKRKYGATERDVLEFWDRACREREKIQQSDEQAARLEKELAAAQDVLRRAAEELTLSRKKAAKELEKRIEEELAFLEMPHAVFVTSFRPKDFGGNGADEAEFFLSVNPGEEPRPLAKIASGGELSRIMLGIRSVLLNADHVDTLIFDEIDTGVSGRAAQKIAKKMRSMSVSCQVISVTHLAQIAAAASAHYLIEKNSDEKRTYTNVFRIYGEDRVREIGRLLGGSSLTPAVLTAAAEMLNENKEP